MNPSAQPLIIQAHHAVSPLRRRLLWLLTLACWTLWASLWWPLWDFVLDGDWLNAGSHYDAATTGMLDAWATIGGYAKGVLLASALLIAWARLSLWRFADNEQRQPVPSLPLHDLAAQLSLSPQVLLGALNAKVAIVHHCPEGGIDRIETPCLP